jgi:orotidine-5'-phosphate decarboxylase
MPISANATGSSVSGRRAGPHGLDEARKRLIVALDFPNAQAASELVNRLENTCQWFKVGLELFTAAGPSIVESLTARGHSIFLDLKFHDIPNTVAGAVRSASQLGARMITLHAAGGPEMLRAAREVLGPVADPPELLAVTVLTSMDRGQLNAVGVDCAPDEQVTKLARIGLDCGIRGFVCSSHEVGALRALTGSKGVLVVPGIRPAGSNRGDQSRIATPADAIHQGASFLVVGRPVTQAPDPAAALTEILQQMAETPEPR